MSEEAYNKNGMDSTFAYKGKEPSPASGEREIYTKTGADNTFYTQEEARAFTAAREMNLKDMRVTPDEFKYYTGIDLDLRLIEKNLSEGNSSNASQMFIERIQRRLNNYISTHFMFAFGGGYRKPSDSMKYHYKMAVIEQVAYVFNNTAVTEDMGLDDNGRPRLSRQDIRQREIGIECQRNLELAGLWNRRVYGGGLMGFFSMWWRI